MTQVTASINCGQEFGFRPIVVTLGSSRSFRDPRLSAHPLPSDLLHTRFTSHFFTTAWLPPPVSLLQPVVSASPLFPSPIL